MFRVNTCHLITLLYEDTCPRSIVLKNKRAEINDFRNGLESVTLLHFQYLLIQFCFNQLCLLISPGVNSKQKLGGNGDDVISDWLVFVITKTQLSDWLLLVT